MKNTSSSSSSSSSSSQPPVISNIRTDDHGVLHFVMKYVDISFANAIRRTLLADIPCVVFRTSPESQNRAVIFTNTSRFNNEIVKQRLGCIPVHCKELDMDLLSKFRLEINVTNNTDSILYVTTEHFKVVPKAPLAPSDVILQSENLFPLSTKIEFLRLRPNIVDPAQPGEQIHLMCDFDIGTANENGMYNSVYISSYGLTPDPAKLEAEMEMRKASVDWKEMTEKDQRFAETNFRLLEAEREAFARPFHYDFRVASVGVYRNSELVMKACDIMLMKLKRVKFLCEKSELLVHSVKEKCMMENCFDIVLENEDYTLGNVLEYFMHKLFFDQSKKLNFISFKKWHPHDVDSVLRVAYVKEEDDESQIRRDVLEAASESMEIFRRIRRHFVPSVRLD